MFITIPCSMSHTHEKGRVYSNVSNRTNGSRRRKGRGGGVGASVLVHYSSVKPSPFSSVACIALEPFIIIKRRTINPTAT